MAAPKYEEVQIDPALQEFENNRIARRARINRPRWNPKEWHPVYEEVVLMDVLGYKRSEIALEKGFTETHITNILKTEQASIIRKIVIKRMEQKREETITQRLDRIAEKAMARVEEVIENDDLAAKNPLGIFDRAIATLRAAKKISAEDEGRVNNKNIFITDEAMTRLMKGTEIADRAKQLHGMVNIDVTPESVDGTVSSP